jgi:hypothetical protein
MPKIDPALILKEGEFERLIEASEGRTVGVAFGPGGVWLNREEDGTLASPWAIPLLQSWRGETVAEGAGI